MPEPQLSELPVVMPEYPRLVLRPARARRLSLQSAALLLGGLALTAPARADNEPPAIHGFVDPCSIAFVEDGTKECEFCPPSDDPKACSARLAPNGYTLACRAIPGHGQPGEVWCRPRPGFLPASKVVPKAEPPRGLYMVGALAVVGAFGVWWVRRKRRVGKAEGSASTQA